MINVFVVFVLFCVCIDDGVRLGEDPNFHQKASNLNFGVLSNRRSSVMQSSVETCVDVDIAN